MQSNGSHKENEKSEDIEFFKKFSRFSENTLGEHLGDRFFRLDVKEAEKRQARHDIKWVEDALLELLRNSRDAGSTHIVIATSLHENRVREIVVIDNGEGIDEQYHQIIFEPRVTSRAVQVIEDEYGVHGRGMALYAISLRSVEAAVAFSRPYAGASIRTLFDLESIPERKNQAEKPRLVRTQDGFELRGPKNLLYTAADFYMKHPHLNIYLGSPAEALFLILKDPAFSSLRKEACVKAEDVGSVIDFSERIGLKLSARHVYRVIKGEVGQPLSIKKMFMKAARRGNMSSILKFSDDDWVQVKSDLLTLIEPLAHNYSLKVKEIRQVKSRGTLKIQVILEDSDDLF